MSDKKEINKSEEIRKVATKMKAGGQKVRPSLIVQELAKQNVVVVPAQVSMVLKRMGFKPLRKRKKRVGGEGQSSCPSPKSSCRMIDILQPVSPGGNV